MELKRDQISPFLAFNALLIVLNGIETIFGRFATIGANPFNRTKWN